MGLAHGGQHAHKHHIEAIGACGIAGLFYEVIELPVKKREAVSAELLRVAVCLNLKLGELGRVVGVGGEPL